GFPKSLFVRAGFETCRRDWSPLFLVQWCLRFFLNNSITGSALLRISKDGLEVLTSDRKSTRLNSSHGSISYAVFCLKKKIENEELHIAADAQREAEIHSPLDMTIQSGARASREPQAIRTTDIADQSSDGSVRLAIPA